MDNETLTAREKELVNKVEALQREVERLQLLSGNERGVLETLLAQSPHGVLVCDAQGKLILQNKASERIWAGSASADSVEGWGKYRAFHPDGRPFEPGDWSMARCLSRGEVVDAEEVHFQRFDDSFGYLLGSCAPTYDNAGNLTGALGVFADITQFKRIEEELRIKDRRLTEDLRQAQAFQLRLLPRIPELDWLKIDVLFQPAELVGGDIYDITMLPSDRVRVFIADATGHGIQAAMRTMILRSEYDRLRHLPEPGQVFHALNDRLAEYPDFDLLCTACCIDVQRTDRGALLDYTLAAHAGPIHLRDDRSETVAQQGTYLAAARVTEFGIGRIELQKGDRVVAFTDGVTEQSNGAKQRFGDEPLIRIMGDRSSSLEQARRKLLHELESFAQPRHFADDITLIGFEV